MERRYSHPGHLRKLIEAHWSLATKQSESHGGLQKHQWRAFRLAPDVGTD
jgi:hypothetical protein